jgi:hypothetical protein
VIPLTGHLPSPVDSTIPRVELAGFMLGAAPQTSGDRDNRAECPPVTQQIANNCCAHALADSAFSVASHDERPIPRPSVSALYAGARQLVAGPGVPLLDQGSQLRAMFQFASTWGLVAENRFPEVPATTNMTPPDDVYRQGERSKLLAYYQVSTGSGCSDRIRAAVYRGRFPLIALVADDAFANVNAEVWTGPGGAKLGGHCVFVCGYRENVNGLAVFLFQNSWGPDFGFDGGFGMISCAAVDHYVYESWVVEAAPGQVF